MSRDEPSQQQPWGNSKSWISANGYAFVSFGGRDYRVHRLVMEQHLGRPLLPTEEVHHINHDKTENRIENLVVKGPAEHIREHWAEGFYAAAMARRRTPDAACGDCGSFGKTRGRGLCGRCYQKHYQRARRREQGAKVRRTTEAF